MEPSPEVLAFAQPLLPAEVSAVPALVAALLSVATVASLEEEAAAAEAVIGEAVEVAAVAAPAVAAVVSSPAARAEYFAARVGLDCLLAHPGRSVAVCPEVAGD